MDPAQYYITTLSTAFGKFGPLLIYGLAGYFLFIKLPFYLMLKVNKDNKPKEQTPENIAIKADEKMKIGDADYQDRLKAAREEKERKQKERQQQEKKSEQKEEKKKEEPKKKYEKLTLAEELFELQPGEKLTQSQLKKKYYKLLKENHPDKVASLGADFKTLAEKKTKEINSAYEELKKKVS